MSAIIICDRCIHCGVCASICPTQAIFEDDYCYKIDPDWCIDCCNCESECLTNAIYCSAYAVASCQSCQEDNKIKLKF